MTELILTEILDNLDRTQRAFLEILAQTDQEILYHRPLEEDWTMAEVLVHIAEARQFFAAETQRVLATRGGKLGRTLENQARLQNIEDHGQDTPEAIRERLITSHQSLVNTVTGIKAEDLQITVEHITYGSQPLAEFLQRFLVGHDQIHVQQATDLLAGRSSQGGK